MTIPSTPASVQEFINLIEVSPGERVLWTSLLSRCLSRETNTFVHTCLQYHFGRKHFETIVRCLEFRDAEAFSGEALNNLVNRVTHPKAVYQSLKATLVYLQAHKLRAAPTAIIAYLECAQQSIEMGRESTNLLETIDHYLKTAGMHDAVDEPSA